MIIPSNLKTGGYSQIPNISLPLRRKNKSPTLQSFWVRLFESRLTLIHLNVNKFVQKRPSFLNGCVTTQFPEFEFCDIVVDFQETKSCLCSISFIESLGKLVSESPDGAWEACVVAMPLCKSYKCTRALTSYLVPVLCLDPQDECILFSLIDQSF